jgi:beta-lactamase regulating signal transducer with metallopeptidase domain
MSMLLTWLWQGAALACATAVLLRLVPRVSASTCHAAWWLTLAVVMLLPVPALFSASGTSIQTAAQPGVLVVPQPPGWMLGAAAGAWAGHAVFGLVGIAAGVRQMRRLRRGSRPLPAATEARLLLCDPGSRGVPIRVSDAVEGAVALGFGQPLVLVSARLADELRVDELEQLIAHERAHLARRDDWTRLAQALVDAAAGLHPAVWFVSRQIDIEREAACDDWAVAHAGDTVVYAECLVRIASAVNPRACGSALLPGVLRRPSTLRRRVARLLDARRSRATRVSHGLVLTIALALVSATLAAGRVPAPVVLDDAEGAAMPSLPQVRPAAAEGPSSVVPSRGGAGPATGKALPVEASRTAAAEVPLRSLPALVAADAIGQAPTVSGLFVAPPPPLGSVPLQGIHLPAAAPAGRAGASSGSGAESDRGSAWLRTADAGLAIGAGASRAGLATGGAATTAGRSIAEWFGRAGKRAADRF